MPLAIGGSPRRASAIKEGADAVDRGEYTELMAADLDAYFDDITAP